MLAVKQKIFAFVFALLCLFSSAQFVLNQHFCCKQLVQVSIIEQNNDCCSSMAGCGSQDTDDGKACCDDKEIIVESEDFLGQVKTDVPTENVTLFSKQFSFLDIDVSDLYEAEDYIQPPPDYSSLGIEYCVFRI